MHLRRYYHIARAQALEEGSEACASVLLGSRDAIAGTNFPASFPARTELITAGYAKVEDLGAPASDPHPADAFKELRKELRAAGLAPSSIELVLIRLGLSQ